MVEGKKENSKDIFEPKRTPKYFVINLLVLAVACAIIWPILEIVWSGITGDSYNWTVANGIVEPIFFAVIFTTIEFLCWNIFHPKKKS